MCVCVNVVFRKVYAASPASLVTPVSCCFVKYNPNDKFNTVGQIRQNDIVVCGKANLQIKKKKQLNICLADNFRNAFSWLI